MRPPTVPLTGILCLVLVPRTEHEACDLFPAALFAASTVHIWYLQLLKLGGFEAKELDSPPAADQRAGGLSQEGLSKIFGAQADGAALVGQLHGLVELQ